MSGKIWQLKNFSYFTKLLDSNTHTYVITVSFVWLSNRGWISFSIFSVFRFKISMFLRPKRRFGDFLGWDFCGPFLKLNAGKIYFNHFLFYLFFFSVPMNKRIKYTRCKSDYAIKVRLDYCFGFFVISVDEIHSRHWDTGICDKRD